ncbi:MAG: hypothetical protein D6819_01240 [Gammaproteobacteria bacterium]|nr:MAG: hypothetical protein D6819_01240 [Gammaproteobacteria bacterium]
MKTMLKVSKHTKAALAFALGCLAWPLWADEVTDAVNDALRYYQKGWLSAAIENLELAAGMIRQKKAAILSQMLPKPLPGWTTDKNLTQITASAYSAGGIVVRRMFKKGDKLIMVSYITDSPLVQTALMMFRDPNLATASGGRFIKVNNRRALFKYATEDHTGEVAFLVRDRILVSIRGYKVKKEDLIAYAKIIDLDRLARIP